MFNYDAESNAMSILRAMSRETVPSRCVKHNFSRTDQQWLIGLSLFLDFSYWLKIVSDCKKKSNFNMKIISYTYT